MIEILEYRPIWVAEFEQISARLRNVLGDAALRVDHVGSTAVPMLCAKDIIDVRVTVRRLEPNIDDRMLKAGFLKHPDVKTDHVPPGCVDSADDWAKLFYLQPTGTRRTHIHVRQVDRPNQRYALLFRDFLRANPSTADAYGELKRRLAAALADAAAYPDVKDPAVDLIYFAAERWAACTGWRPPNIEVPR